MITELKIRTKLLIGFSCVAIIAGVIGMISIQMLRKTNASNTQLYEKTTLRLEQCTEIASLFQQIRVNVAELIVTDRIEDVQKKHESCLKLSADFDTVMAHYQKTINDTVDSLKHDAIMRAKWEYMGVVPGYVRFIKENDRETAKVFLSDFDQFNKTFQKASNDLIAYNIAIGKTMLQVNTKVTHKAVFILLLFIVIGSIVALVLGLFIARNIQKILESVIQQSNKLTKAAIDGNLTLRGNPDEVNFEFREIVIGLNNTLDAVIQPLTVAAYCIERIAKGDLPDFIVEQYNGDFDTIKNNINQLIETFHLITESAKHIAKGNLNSTLELRSENDELMIAFKEMINSVHLLIDDSKMLTIAAINGQLAVRADTSKHQGDFREIIEGVNKTLDSLISPLTISTEYIYKISKGEIPAKITEPYNGDFNQIKELK